MENCLVTKLKGTVDNDNLLKLGEVRIPVVNGTIESLGIITGTEPQVIRGLGSVKLNGESSITCNAGWTNNIVITGVPENGIGYISIPDKYHILGINGENSIVVKGNLYDTLGLMESCVQWRPGYNSEYPLGSIVKALPYSTIVKIGNKMSGSISDLFPLKNTVTQFSTDNGPFTIGGTFDDLGHFYKVNNYATIFRLGLVGTVEGFVANRLIEQPQTAGSVTIKWLGDNGHVTFNGVAIENKADNTIAWDAQGNITLS